MAFYRSIDFGTWAAIERALPALNLSRADMFKKICVAARQVKAARRVISRHDNHLARLASAPSSGGIEPPSIDGPETGSSRSRWRAAGIRLVRSSSGSNSRKSLRPVMALPPVRPMGKRALAKVQRRGGRLRAG